MQWISLWSYTVGQWQMMRSTSMYAARFCSARKGKGDRKQSNVRGARSIKFAIYLCLQLLVLISIIFGLWYREAFHSLPRVFWHFSLMSDSSWGLCAVIIIIFKCILKQGKSIKIRIILFLLNSPGMLRNIHHFCRWLCHPSNKTVIEMWHSQVVSDKSLVCLSLKYNS